MSLRNRYQSLEKRLRVALIATALLFIPVIGQCLTLSGPATGSSESELALAFMFAGLIIIPTSAILSAAILYTLRHTWRHHRAATILAALNLAIALQFVIFLFR